MKTTNFKIGDIVAASHIPFLDGKKITCGIITKVDISVNNKDMEIKMAIRYPTNPHGLIEAWTFKKDVKKIKLSDIKDENEVNWIIKYKLDQL